MLTSGKRMGLGSTHRNTYQFDSEKEFASQLFSTSFLFLTATIFD